MLKKLRWAAYIFEKVENCSILYVKPKSLLQKLKSNLIEPRSSVEKIIYDNKCNFNFPIHLCDKGVFFNCSYKLLLSIMPKNKHHLFQYIIDKIIVCKYLQQTPIKIILRLMCGQNYSCKLIVRWYVCSLCSS